MFVKSIGFTRRSGLLRSHARKLFSELDFDLVFLTTGAQLAKATYNKALQGGKAS